MNTCLYEAWLSCEGNRKKSRLYLSICNKNRKKTTGVRRWFLRSELEKRFGVDVATDIVNRKLNDEKLKESETRLFEELPDREDATVWGYGHVRTNHWEKPKACVNCIFFNVAEVLS